MLKPVQLLAAALVLGAENVPLLEQRKVDLALVQGAPADRATLHPGVVKYLREAGIAK